MAIDADLIFMGEYVPRVDQKGRMTIPQDLREVLAAGDPAAGIDTPPRMLVQSGLHLKGHVKVYTMEAFAVVRAKIMKIPEGTPQSNRLRRNILGRSKTYELDKDGRVVLEKDLRDRLGLGVQECTILGAGEFFEIWNAEALQAHEAAEEAALLAAEDSESDPMALLMNVEV